MYSALLFSYQSPAQVYPKMVDDRYPAPIFPPFVPVLDIDYELTGASRIQDDNFLQALAQLKQDSENERLALENEYYSATGETKINKAMELIELALHYMKLYDELLSPGLGHFSGDFRMTLVFQQTGIAIDMDCHGTEEVFLEEVPDATISPIARKMHRTVTGQADFSASIMSFMDIQGTGTFSDTLTGYRVLDFVFVKQKSFQINGVATIKGGIPQFKIIALR